MGAGCHTPRVADVSILDSSVHAAPKGYTVKGAQEIIVRSVTASFDGTSAAGSFVPAVQIVDPSGFVTGTYPLDSPLAVGALADISWFPGLGAGSSSPTDPMMFARVELVGDLTIATGDPGALISWNAATFDLGSPNPFWTSLHPARLTAPVTGYYLSIVNPIWDDAAALPDGELATYFYINTETPLITTSKGKEASFPLTQNITFPHFSFPGQSHGIYHLNAGDYAVLNAFADTGSGAGSPATIKLLDLRTHGGEPQLTTSWTLILLAGEVGPVGPPGGGLNTVTDGATTVTPATTLTFTSGATVTNGGGGNAQVAVSGGGGGAVASAHVNRTAGDLAITDDNAYHDVPLIGDLSVAAATNDVLAISVNGVANQSVRFEIELPNSGNYVGPGIVGTQGIAGFANRISAAGDYGGTIFYTVQAGDIAGGNVLLRLRYSTATSGATTLFASTSVGPLCFAVANLRH